MTRYDVFNGDADGICALQQIRLAEPFDTTLVTGVKRDIGLLQRVDAVAGDAVTVLDVSLDKNRDALQRVLDAGASVRYFDHHFAGEIPDHARLQAHIDTTPDIGTCYLVDAYLGGAHRAWAVVGSFGDNFDATATRLADPLGLDQAQLAELKQLGICINYNGYGPSLEDLHFAPAELYQRIRPYADPLDFIHNDEAYRRLLDGYREDMRLAAQLPPERQTDRLAVYVLPAERWARRVSGVFANDLAQAAPDRAHALLTRCDQGGFVVSVRAPLNNRTGADDLCRQFATGGGRKAAAGINHLPDEQFDLFTTKFTDMYAA